MIEASIEIHNCIVTTLPEPFLWI